MKRISIWRLALIGAITLGSLIMFFPTVRYFIALRNPDMNPEKLEELRKAAIPLGLDLRGGVDVTLTIDTHTVQKGQVAALAGSLKREFDENQVSAAVGPTTDGMSVSVKALDAASARTITNLVTKYDYALLTGDATESRLATMQEIILPLKPDYLKRDADRMIKSVEKILRDRLDKFGLTQPSIAAQGTDRIRIQVPGERDPDKLIQSLTRLAKMEFRQTHEAYLTAEDPINKLLDKDGNLLPGAYIPPGYELSNYRFGRINKATGKIEYKEGKILIETLPSDPEKQLTGANLRQTGVQQDLNDLENPIKVSIQFDDKGGQLFGDMTRESVKKLKDTGRSRNLAILLDNTVVSAPTMQHLITGGSAVIEGGFTMDEADDLSKLLKAGSLPAPLVPESKRTVGATLGTESIFDGIKALVYGTIVIVIFMIVYYGTAGFIAVLALFMNLLIIAAVMALSKATLTLAGIGGILLTVGMAVDSNVLIYERMREEMEAGRPMKQALSLGFDRAFGVIVDSHMTTLMSALILLQFTEGSVFGFALSMTFGLVANLYTGLGVTYTLCAAWFQWRGHLSLGKMRMFTNTAFDFINARFLSFGLSGALTVGGLVILLITGGFKFGVDFTGGLLAEVDFTKPTTENEIRADLEAAGLKGERVQSVAGANEFIIRVKTLDVKTDGQVTPLQKTEQVLEESIKAKVGADGYTIKRVDSFGAETGQSFRSMAFIVTTLASLAILAYLWLRFELVFGVAAVIALLHDLFLTITFGSLWGVEVSLDVVASLMVLLGFSVNDTIVIFDRIRENSRKYPNKSFKQVCNEAMNQSLARTFITSGTVFMTMLVMYIFGGEGLAPFAKVMIIGSIFGTYSSCFVAAPLVYLWDQYKKGGVVATITAKKVTGPEPARDPLAERPANSPANMPKRRGV